MKQTVVQTLVKTTKLNKQEIENLLAIPPSQELGDYAFPCFALAKKLKKKPGEIAQDLASKIKSKNFEKIEAKGPYLNFFLNKEKLAEQTLAEIYKQKENYGSSKFGKEKIIIEFSQPNTHKAFHVGHIRGTALGESIARLLEFTGNKPIRANYSGDTGMHIAKWLWCYKKFHHNELIKDDEEWIASIYVDAVKRLAENKETQIEVEELNRKLETRDNKELNALWKKTRQSSINAWKKIYKELNTKFDVHYFESEMETPAKELIQNLLKKKIAKISDGATIIEFKDHKEPSLGVAVLLRKDGTVLYGGKDIALAEKKYANFKPQKSLYVVGKAQELYFHQVLKIFELMKSPLAEKSRYIPLSEVRLPTGKMSSRTGENILYSSFKNELVEYAKEEIKKRQQLPAKELQKRAQIIAITSMKYTMLRQDLNKTITFDKKEAMNFEGNTGPYILYTYARAKSILRKKQNKKQANTPKPNNKEKKIILELATFPEIAAKAASEYAPNYIANYVYKLAQAFNEFYHTNKVIGSENETSRVKIVEATAQVLKNALNLLGIETLEEM